MHEYHYIGYHFVRRSDCTFISFYAPKEFSFDYLLFCFLILMPMAHTVSENSHCSLVIKPSKIKQYKCDPRIVPIWLWCVAVYQNLSILSIYHLCLSIFLYLIPLGTSSCCSSQKKFLSYPSGSTRPRKVHLIFSSLDLGFNTSNYCY